MIFLVEIFLNQLNCRFNYYLISLLFNNPLFTSANFIKYYTYCHVIKLQIVFDGLIRVHLRREPAHFVKNEILGGKNFNCLFV